jgi:hypothetical protein
MEYHRHEKWRHLSWRWCSIACAFTWSLRLLLLLWGCLKSTVVISKRRTIGVLKQRVKEEIAAIPEQMTRRVMENLPESFEQCLRNCGGHLRDEIFKNKMACTEFVSDNNCYIIRWDVTVLLRFENRHFFCRILYYFNPNNFNDIFKVHILSYLLNLM